jgi:hypothetical protein
MAKKLIDVEVNVFNRTFKFKGKTVELDHRLTGAWKGVPIDKEEEVLMLEYLGDHSEDKSPACADSDRLDESFRTNRNYQEIEQYPNIVEGEGHYLALVGNINPNIIGDRMSGRERR